jgi:hypothetical protein
VSGGKPYTFLINFLRIKMIFGIGVHTVPSYKILQNITRMKLVWNGLSCTIPSGGATAYYLQCLRQCH